MNYIEYFHINRPILSALIVKYVKGPYKSSFLGYLWYLLNPLTLAVSYYIAFVNVLNYSLPNYIVYLMSGLFSTVFFLHGTIGGSNAIVSEASLIEKINFSRILIPIAYTFSKFIMFLVSEIIVLALLVILGHPLNAVVILMMPLMMFEFVFMVGLISFLSALTVYIRDLGNMLSYMGTLLSWISPTAYLPSDTSGLLSLVIKINPMTYFLNCYHSILYCGIFPEILDIVACIFFSLIMVIVGVYVFEKLKDNFLEVL